VLGQLVQALRPAAAARSYSAAAKEVSASQPIPGHFDLARRVGERALSNLFPFWNYCAFFLCPDGGM